MSSSSDNSNCPTNCWIAAAVLGAVLFLILWLGADWAFIWSLLLGLIVCVAAGFILQMMLCTEAQAFNAPPQAAVTPPPSAPAIAAAVVEPEADVSETEAEAEPEAQPEPDPEPEVQPERVAQTPSPEPEPEPAADVPQEDEGAALQPTAMDAARDGGADDLKKIKGVGPKLEQLLFSLGIFHFDQIAGWGADEVAWMDDNIAGFKGRVTRDNWVEQAGLLAAGEETDFSRKVDDGNVY